MTRAIVFPGQGSQHRGMGADVFDAFPDYVRLADDVLGYSIKELCLEDRDGRLADTRYTQPALFVVNALKYLARRAEPGGKPDVFAGHSLGEYDALFAAGVFDFATGVQLVRRRGELMAKAPAGGMAAVVGLEPGRIREVLRSARLDSIDVANFNSQEQTVVGGPRAEIERAGPFFTEAGARYVALNVGAAFHSRYMAEAEVEFRELLEQVEIRPPDTPVLANYTARPYARQPARIRETLARQISNPVRWYEIASYLLSLPEPQIEEVGPGNVLKGLTARIRLKPMQVAAFPLEHEADAEGEEDEVNKESENVAARPAVTASGNNGAGVVVIPAADVLNNGGGDPRGRLGADRGIVFMYTGQGSQYYGMGEALYKSSTLYRDAFDLCSRIAEPLLGRSLSDIVYQDNSAGAFDRLLYSDAANFALGFALTQVLFDRGVRPDAVLGYGAGEFLAATVAGCLTLGDALSALAAQAKLLEESNAGGQMLAVFAPADVLEQVPALGNGFNVAGYNFGRHFIVTGGAPAVGGIERELSARGVICQPLPVKVALHSPLMDGIESDFRRAVATLSFAPARVRMYSPTRLRWVSRIDADYLWHACRDAVRFGEAVKALRAEGVARFVDLGPSGTLAGFVRYQLDDKERALTAINRFGRNCSTLAALFETLEV